MSSTPAIQSVETGEEYVHVRFRDPDAFETIRTPDWAAKAASEVSAGAEVRMGKRSGSDDWAVQSVLVDVHVGEAKAREQAVQILEKIES